MSSEFSHLTRTQGFAYLDEHPSITGLSGFSKRLVDVTLSSIGILLLLPVFLILSVLIMLDSPGPIFFRQRRVGLKGQEFWMYKFRSMVVDAEARLDSLMAHNEIKDGGVFKMTNDPRITPLGRWLRKTSLDEIPQLFNVLRGDMSLVGPRPLPTYEVARHATGQLRRLEVMPGCTGLWQTSGRSDLDSFKQMVELDIEYMRNWSLTYDFSILFKTIRVLLKTEGAR